jgi:hypothetical protein
MGVLEVVAVFQAVTEQPVRADMREPDQAEGQDQRPALPPAETRERGRQEGAEPGWLARVVRSAGVLMRSSPLVLAWFGPRPRSWR